jgi:head-tail adaptor
MDLASKLDTRVRIERKTVTLDPAYGTQEVSWSLFANVWGEVRDVLPSRAERLAETITIANRPARVRVRYLPGLAADMRLIIGGRIMQIISGPAMLGRREAMELIVEDHSTEGDAP